ncbi:hypothetical protein BDN72DRAFT_500226 [Pluteus cervinus]|uniref:Uncharacterized protein n=1 Tax=Pluteus cervinus TaxID=181527 RepID=A0ACD3AZZ3_9AGAR|nr:hypothetical protein BDN72DRAFT_500226 [Pluteus cervinus]
MDMDQLATIVSEAQIARLFNMAAITIFIYDYLLTVEREITLIWPSKWSFLKVAFLVQRYLPFFDTLSWIIRQSLTGVPTPQCVAHYYATTIMLGVGIIISEVVLTLRVWSVYDNSRRLGRFFIGFYAIIAVTIGVSKVLYLISVSADTLPIPRISCMIHGDKYPFAATWIALALCNIVMFILMVVPAISNKKKGEGSILLKVIFRDGITYYFCLMIMSVVNVVFVLSFPPILGFSVMVSLERFTHSMMTSRVVIHIREEAHKTQLGYQTFDEFMNKGDNESAFELIVRRK